MSPDGTLTIAKDLPERPVRGIFILKIFGRGVGVTPYSAGRCPQDRGYQPLLTEPFPRKFFPDKRCILRYGQQPVRTGFFVCSGECT